MYRQQITVSHKFLIILLMAVAFVPIVFISVVAWPESLLEQELKKMAIGDEIHVIYSTSRRSTSEIEVDDEDYGDRVFFITCHTKRLSHNRYWDGQVIGYHWKEQKDEKGFMENFCCYDSDPCDKHK